MSEWIKMTPSLEKGLKAIDRLDNGKFRALLNHLCSTQRLGVTGKVFSHEEERKLLTALEVDEETLKILLNTIEFIYLQAGYGLVKPAAMKTLMLNVFPISEEKVAIFTNVWAAHSKAFIETLRHKSIFPVQVDDVNWAVNVQSSSSATSQAVNSVLWLQLALAGRKEAKLTVELDNNNLSYMYNKFEDIQRQLDLLEWVPEKN